MLVLLREYAADAQFLRKMRAAQRAWVTYRDAHLAALYPAADPQSQYGSVYTMCRCTALAEATRKRAEELRRWADGTAEGDVCAGSVRVRTAADASAGAAQTGDAAALFGK